MSDKRRTIAALPSEAEQVPYPHLQYQVMASGVLITKMSDPTESHSQLIPASMMDDLVRDWRASRSTLIDISQAIKLPRND